VCGRGLRPPLSLPNSEGAGHADNDVARYEHYWIDLIASSASIRQKLDGSGYGGEIQVGGPVSHGFFVEPAASLECVRTLVQRLLAAPATLSFGDADGLRGRAGARVGVEGTSGVTAMTFYLSGQLVHEFRGDDTATFASGGQTVRLRSGPLGDYGRGTLGFNIASGGRVSRFVEAFVDRSDTYSGDGGRGGLSIKF
jgi:hypothetical protein